MAPLSDLFCWGWRGGDGRENVVGGRKEAGPRDSFAPSSPSPGLIMKGDMARGSRVKPKGDSIVLKLSRTATYFDMHRARLLSVVHANWRGRPVIGKKRRADTAAVGGGK